jgi:predicted enzyme related to lactoylglutathione lyase
MQIFRPREIVLSSALACFLLLSGSPSEAQTRSGGQTEIAVGPQYGTTHVYVVPGDLEAFVKSFLATFGGSATKPVVTSVTPVPSSTVSEVVRTPVGVLSIFAYQTPIPYPFGEERTGNLVTDMDRAVQAARAAGGEIVVAPFNDPIGRDAIIQWPGGVKMQLYWHTAASTSPPLASVPESRVYLSPDEADHFVKCFVAFSSGKVVADDRHADAAEIGRAGATYRRIRIASLFGDTQVLVTDGHLPYPFGHEWTGYQVQDLRATLDKAKAAGVKILSAPQTVGDRTSSIVQFPGGYIAEIHSVTAR